MISSALAFMLLMAPAADNTPSARRAYSACINQFMAKGLDEKLEPTAFDSALSTACTDKAAALRSAAISAAKAAKRSLKDAESMVGGDIEDYHANAKEMFREYKATNSKPPL